MHASPKICVPIISETQNLTAAEMVADLYEVRIDLIGREWRRIASHLKKPWLACNRRVEEGGTWHEKEDKRVKELLSALEIGAKYVDIELGTPELNDVVQKVKGKAEVIISYHNLLITPSFDRLCQVVNNELAAGADICKVVTTATRIADNVTMLELIRYFSAKKIISFAMGALGQISRVLCPVAGGYMTWASTEEGSESAAGQIAVEDIRRIYRTLDLL